MSAKQMTPVEMRRVNDEIVEQLSLLGVELPYGGDFFEKPGWELALVAATGTAARAAEKKAAALRRRSDRIGDDPIAADYLDDDDVSPIVDESDGVHVEDSDDDWEGHDATPELDRFFPRRKRDAADGKSDDAPRATPKAADGPRQTPLARILRTDGGGGGKSDHEPAERKPRTAMTKFLERRRK